MEVLLIHTQMNCLTRETIQKENKFTEGERLMNENLEKNKADSQSNIKLITTETIPDNCYIEEVFEMEIYLHRHFVKWEINKEADIYFEALEEFKNNVPSNANAILNVKIENTFFTLQNPDDLKTQFNTIQMIITGTPVIIKEYDEELIQYPPGQAIGGGMSVSEMK